MSRKLDRLLDLKTLAERIGVSRVAIRKRIVRLHKRHGGIVVRVSPSACGEIFVSESGLRTACPELFLETHATRQEHAELSVKVAELQKRLNAQAAAIREFKAKANEWFKRDPK